MISRRDFSKGRDFVQYALGQSVRVSKFLGQALIGNFALGRRPPPERLKTLPGPQAVLTDLKRLFEKDFENIRAGLYKMPKSLAGDPLNYSRSSLKFLKDLLLVRERQQKKSVQEFSASVPKNEFPKYYAQTFHFQTDGYLSDSSAELYDHQVELVFAGAADTMRRQALVPLFHKVARGVPQSEAAFQLLDLACGTGSFLEAVADNYPNCRMTGIDLSPWYLKRARARLKDFLHANFIEANAERLPIQDDSFDAVTCIFLFHELPRSVRRKVASEIARLLKKGGVLIFVDAIQQGDKPSFDGSLDFFPVNYYEPYFLDYITDDLKQTFEQVGLKLESTDLAFFSKVVTFTKT